MVNPVESRLASMEHPAPFRSLTRAEAWRCSMTYRPRQRGLSDVLKARGLAMDADIALLQAYFRDEEKRDPTITELRI